VLKAAPPNNHHQKNDMNRQHQSETASSRRDTEQHHKQTPKATQEALNRSYGWNGIIWNDWMNCDGVGSNEAMAEEALEQMKVQDTMDVQTLEPTIRAADGDDRDSTVVVSFLHIGIDYTSTHILSRYSLAVQMAMI
jgi:hypothetical protein